MQINVTLDEYEAADLTKQEVANKLGVSLHELKVTIANSLSLSNKDAANRNKIWMIKLIRNLMSDYLKQNGQCDVIILNKEQITISLDSAKNWIEDYIAKNCQ